MSNYPDNMDWGAYDAYHDPKLMCGMMVATVGVNTTLAKADNT